MLNQCSKKMLGLISESLPKIFAVFRKKHFQRAFLIRLWLQAFFISMSRVTCMKQTANNALLLAQSLAKPTDRGASLNKFPLQRSGQPLVASPTVDVSECPDGGGQMRIVAALMAPTSIRTFYRINSIFRVSTRCLPACSRYRYIPLASSRPASSRPFQRSV